MSEKVVITNKCIAITLIFYVIFHSLPKQRIYTREVTENSDIKLYDRAYRKGRAIDDCSEIYDCSFSLLELAFGRYSTPPTGYYKQH